MSNPTLDEQFQRKLFDQSAEVPAGTWEGIQRQLPLPREPRKPWILAWAVFGFALVVILGSLFIEDNVSEEKPANANFSIASIENGITAPVVEAKLSDIPTESVELPDFQQTQNNSSNAELSNQSILQETTTGGHAPGGGGNPLVTISVLPTTDVVLSSEVSTQESKSIAEAQVHIIDKTVNREVSGILSLASRRAVLSFDHKHQIITTDCYSFGKGVAGNLLIDLYAGPTFASKFLTSRSEDVRDYINSRDTTEFSRLGFHVGLRVGYQHLSGFFARIGAHYTQVNERFDYINGSSSQTIITTDTIFDSGGNIVDIVLDTISVSGTRIKKTFNRFHTIDIPLLAGYQIENGDWAYGLQAGPVLNVAFTTKGDILAPNGVPGSFSDQQASDYHPVFKDKLGLSVYGAAYIQRRVAESIYAFVEPHVLHRLKSITLDGYPIDQRQTTFGLSFGLRLKL